MVGWTTIVFVAAAAVVAFPATADAAAFAGVPPRQPKLIWEDNFDTLDPGKWGHLITAWRGGNDEFQYYRDDRRNSFVDGGTLKIKPTLARDELSDDTIRHGSYQAPGCNMEPCVSQAGGDIASPVFSARVWTRGIFDFAFGRIEVRAKLPRGDWLWPAIWMYPSEEFYGGWPASGEIDIVEGRGNKDLKLGNGQSVGVNFMGSTMHWGGPWNPYWLTHWEYTLPTGDFSDDFHVFELEWTQEYMAYKVDGHEIGSVRPPAGGFWELANFPGDNIWAKGTHMAPFDRPFYIMLNVAVGGRFFGDDMINSPDPRPWDWASGHPMLQFYEATDTWLRSWDRPQMEIDYVRIYEI